MEEAYPIGESCTTIGDSPTTNPLQGLDLQTASLMLNLQIQFLTFYDDAFKVELASMIQSELKIMKLLEYF